MGKGKIAAQCSHATIGVVNRVLDDNDEFLLAVWRTFGQPKIVTKIDSITELLSRNLNVDFVKFCQYPCTNTNVSVVLK